MGRARNGTTATADPFAQALGSRRGRGAASQLTASRPDDVARAECQELIRKAKSGDCAPALRALHRHRDVDAPLLDELREALVAAGWRKSLPERGQRLTRKLATLGHRLDRCDTVLVHLRANKMHLAEAGSPTTVCGRATRGREWERALVGAWGASETCARCAKVADQFPETDAREAELPPLQRAAFAPVRVTYDREAAAALEGMLDQERCPSPAQWLRSAREVLHNATTAWCVQRSLREPDEVLRRGLDDRYNDAWFAGAHAGPDATPGQVLSAGDWEELTRGLLAADNRAMDQLRAKHHTNVVRVVRRAANLSRESRAA